jgi:hypothetical protein
MILSLPSEEGKTKTAKIAANRPARIELSQLFVFSFFDLAKSAKWRYNSLFAAGLKISILQSVTNV